MDQLKEFINEMGCKIHDNLCYPVNIRNEFATEISVNLDTLLEKIKCIYRVAGTYRSGFILLQFL